VKERANFAGTPVELMIGFTQQYSEAVSRGYNEKVTQDALMVMGALALNLRGLRTQGGVDSKVKVDLPVELLFMPISMGGVGMYCRSALGASKDGPLYMLYSRVERAMIDRAKYIIKDVKDKDKRQLISEIEDTKVFQPGIDFMTKNLPQERVASSIKAQARLDKKGLGLKNTYLNSPKRMIEQVLSDGKGLKDLNFRLQFSNAVSVVSNLDSVEKFKIKALPINLIISDHTGGLNIRSRLENDSWWFEFDYRLKGVSIAEANSVINSTGRRLCVMSTDLIDGIFDEVLVARGVSTSDEYDAVAKVLSPKFNKTSNKKILPYMDIEFDWLKHFDYDWGEVIPIKEGMDIVPIAGLDPVIEDMIKRVGMSIGGDTNALKMHTIFGKLKDKFFPATVTDAEIFREITKPGIAGDINRMTDVLMAMGAEESRAFTAAEQMEKLITKFVFLSKTSTYSTRDGVIGHMDLSRENYERMVTVPDLADANFVRVLESIGFLMIVMDGGRVNLDDPIREIRIYIDGVNWVKARLAVQGRFKSDILINNSEIFPRTYV
jgi:hypothetical protein